MGPYPNEDMAGLPFANCFEKIRLESKWNTTKFWVIPVKNFPEQ